MRLIISGQQSLQQAITKCEMKCTLFDSGRHHSVEIKDWINFVSKYWHSAL